MRMQTRIRHDDKPRVNKHGQGRRDFRDERAWGTVGASAGHMGLGRGARKTCGPTGARHAVTQAMGASAWHGMRYWRSGEAA